MLKALLWKAYFHRIGSWKSKIILISNNNFLVKIIFKYFTPKCPHSIRNNNKPKGPNYKIVLSPGCNLYTWKIHIQNVYLCRGVNFISMHTHSFNDLCFAKMLIKFKMDITLHLVRKTNNKKKIFLKKNILFLFKLYKFNRI